MTKALRRISSAQIGKIFGNLEKRDQMEAIHCARKNIKKLRALLRLLRAEMKERDYRNAMNALRKAAKILAAPRDAHVTLQAFDKLAAHFKNELAPKSFAGIKKLLRKNCREKIKGFLSGNLAWNVSSVLRKMFRRVKKLTVETEGWPAIQIGLKRSYNGGRKMQKAVLKNSAPENFHEWRKRVKDLWYHLRLLRPIWPEEMNAAADELKILGEQLGDDHDLTMLKQFVADHCADKNREEAEALNRLIDLRRRDLRSAALAIGARFYSEKPSTFCKRIENYWNVWRGERKKKRD